MKHEWIFRGGIIVFGAYLIWIWGFGYDKSVVPEIVIQEWRDAPWSHYFLSQDESVFIWMLRKPLAFISLALMWQYRNFGRWGFLVFSVLGPILLLSDDWSTTVLWYEGLSWSIHWLQGALLVFCFTGPIAEEFSRKKDSGDRPSWQEFAADDVSSVGKDSETDQHKGKMG